MRLLEVFSAIAYKRIASVDIPGRGSNQHELNATVELRRFFGSDTKSNVKLYYFADDSEILEGETQITVYDSRAKSFERTKRTEWRAYYKGDFLAHANPGDLLVFARTQKQEIYGLIFQQDSSWYRSAEILFEVGQTTDQLQLLDDETLRQDELEFVRQRILEELSIDVILPSRPSDEDLVIEKFNSQFPTTIKMSEYARERVAKENGRLDPTDADLTLVTWLQREEELFRALERIIVSKQLENKFESVDQFISYSLSVQNRRKSRMGHALQNHLSALFDANEIKYSPQAITEGKKKPDFIFPSEEHYHDNQFDKSLLVMLAAKASCKDRWRQVISEAAKIIPKHLCTLQPSISINQTQEMKTDNVILVVPQNLHSTYVPEQLSDIMTVTEFIEFVRKRQKL